jgi:hypothetical protein
MPKIRLNDSEIEQIRSFYTDELKEATKYVEQVKTIIAKFKTKDKPKPTKPTRIEQVPQPKLKPGRKPSIKAEPTDAQEPKPLVRKANAPRQITEKPAIELPKKRGRKPTLKVDVTKTVELMPKVRAKRGAGKKKVEPKKAVPEIPSVIPAEKIAANAVQEKPTVTVEPKPKRKRIHNADHKGKVLLAGWKKSVPKKPKGNAPIATNGKT